MTKLIVAKFGGSAIGPDGIFIPDIIKRINDLKKDSKGNCSIFSAINKRQRKKTFADRHSFRAGKKYHYWNKSFIRCCKVYILQNTRDG